MSRFKKSKYNKIKAILRENSEDPCVFCNRTIDDELTYGNFYTLHDVSCHYFCVLLSSCAVQYGNDNEGLFGFLYSNITAEVERGKKNKCSYCHKRGATLGCSFAQCRKQFHLPCGRERNAVSIFHGTFKSFCERHAPKQAIPSSIMALARARKKNGAASVDEDNSVCVICCEHVPGYPSPSTFWPPCCARDVWFHRLCIQRMALSSGAHYLKCPLCNDKDVFYEAVLRQGFYIPDRDAAWELEQNAFNDMYERPVKCDADACKCDKGRNYDSETGLWDIKLCLLCGSVGSHVGCQIEPQSRFVCDSCAQVPMPDLDELERALESVRMQESEAVSRQHAPTGPPMPSRMSLRRTKLHRTVTNTSPEAAIQKEKAASKEETKTSYLSELDSISKNLKIEFNKNLIEMCKEDVIALISQLKTRAERPMPMRFKKMISGIITELEMFMMKEDDNKHQDKVAIIEISDSEESSDVNVDGVATENKDTIEASDNKLKIIDIKDNSSLEISEANESVHIDVVNVHTNAEEAAITRTRVFGRSRNKCALKFGLIDRECLDNFDCNIDIELFHRNYLKEIYKNKINFNERDNNASQFENGTSLERDIENLKFEDKTELPGEKIKKFKNKKKRRAKKNKLKKMSPEVLKKVVLNSPNKSLLSKISDKGREYRKRPKSNDNFKQTTLFNYFNCRP